MQGQKLTSQQNLITQNLLHPIRSYSSQEVIPGRSHTSLREFRALRQFNETGKSPQIMGMLQNLISISYIQIGFFEAQRSCEGRVLLVLR